MYYYKYLGNLFSSAQKPFFIEGVEELTEEQYASELAELQAIAEVERLAQEEAEAGEEATIEDYQAAFAELEEIL